MVVDIFLTLFLVFLNGFFVAAEFAIVKVRSSQLELRLRTGSKSAKLAKSLTENLDAYLSATQLGITLASLGLGWIGESVVADIIKEVLLIFGFSLSVELTHQIALPIAFVTITILHIVFGELAPKSVAIQRPESVSLIISIPLRIFYILFKPFIWILNSFANLIIKILGFQSHSAESELHSSEEILFLLEESSKSGVEGMPDKDLIENVFDFSDTPVKQIMVPRGSISGIELNTPIDTIIESIIDEGYSRLPIYNHNIDNILGVIVAKDLISILKHEQLIILQDIIRPPYFVYEDQKINILLKEMQLRKIHFAVVLNEFGGTAGIVTLEDIIEEIVGEIQDEYDEEIPKVENVTKNIFKVQAITAIDDANDFLPIPIPEDEDYETVGGYIVSYVGRIPVINEEIELDDYMCTIISGNERNIIEVQLKIIEKNTSKNIED